MKTKFHHLFIALALFAGANRARAQGTAFTYQGRLNDGTNPANGSYDFTFSLFNASGGGAQTGVTLTSTAVGVTNGLFTVTEDFGAVFNGTPYWLQIGVRTNGGGVFTALSPRQALTPAPYAIFAEGANAAQLSGTVPNSLLSPDVALLDGNQTFTGLNSFSGNLSFLDPTKSITFPATGGANAPMMQMFALGTVNADRMVIAHSPAFPTWGLQYQDVPDRFNFLAAGIPVMSVNLGAQSVGIGVTNPASKLEVTGDVRIDGNTLLLESATAGVYANDGLVFGDGNLAGGINYLGNGPWLAGYEGGALGGLAPNIVALSWDAGGNASVNNNLSTGSLTVRGDYLVVNGGTPVYAYIGDDGSGNDVQIGSQKSGVTAVACYNTADNAYMHLYCSSITIEGGADVAEPFQISKPDQDQAISPGAVVVIDEENPGHLKLADRPYDSRVAGVVSGANGVNPGIQMQQQGLLEGGKNVALTGRVYVQADTSNGAIKPGDLLTTSSTPGRAMKVSDHLKARGAILGKAMTRLKDGQGMVLVLVTLQ